MHGYSGSLCTARNAMYFITDVHVACICDAFMLKRGGRLKRQRRLRVRSNKLSFVIKSGSTKVAVVAVLMLYSYHLAYSCNNRDDSWMQLPLKSFGNRSCLAGIWQREINQQNKTWSYNKLTVDKIFSKAGNSIWMMVFFLYSRYSKTKSSFYKMGQNNFTLR